MMFHLPTLQKLVWETEYIMHWCKVSNIVVRWPQLLTSIYHYVGGEKKVVLHLKYFYVKFFDITQSDQITSNGRDLKITSFLSLEMEGKIERSGCIEYCHFFANDFLVLSFVQSMKVCHHKPFCHFTQICTEWMLHFLFSKLCSSFLWFALHCAFENVFSCGVTSKYREKNMTWISSVRRNVTQNIQSTFL